ncbi:MAG TPA: hypothetical protein VFB28_01545 [Terriglobales bacterium]|nr:hypothetical protein [Terriglobales bacterium]
MAEKKIKKVVEKLVAEVLESYFPKIQQELTDRVLEQVEPQSGTPGLVDAGADDLLKAITLIHGGTTQKEILRALLDATTNYCGRAALFVMKAGAATGWQGRAFDNNDDIKDFALDVSATAPAQVLQSRTSVNCHIAEMDSKFISQFGAPSQDAVFLLPLHLKDKIAALVYADGGMDGGGALDGAALALIVAATSAWLEVASLRKQAAKEGSPDSPVESAPVPVQTVSSYSDPFAGHAPMHAATVAAAESAEPVVAAAAAGAGAAAAPAKDAFAQMSPEDAEVHRKAQRFARLLTDEIKLYNQAKVAEGRKHKDLYDRLKEDIEKSRVTYVKRYGNTVAASGDYFNNEIVRSLAEDDVSLMGANFRK